MEKKPECVSSGKQRKLLQNSVTSRFLALFTGCTCYTERTGELSWGECREDKLVWRTQSQWRQRPNTISRKERNARIIFLIINRGQLSSELNQSPHAKLSSCHQNQWYLPPCYHFSEMLTWIQTLLAQRIHCRKGGCKEVKYKATETDYFFHRLIGLKSDLKENVKEEPESESKS